MRKIIIILLLLLNFILALLYLIHLLDYTKLIFKLLIDSYLYEILYYSIGLIGIELQIINILLFNFKNKSEKFINYIIYVNYLITIFWIISFFIFL